MIAARTVSFLQRIVMRMAAAKPLWAQKRIVGAAGIAAMLLQPTHVAIMAALM
jgi:hypothetical protein